MAISHYVVTETSAFPNNNSLPLLIYDQPFSAEETPPDLARAFEKTFTQHDWPAAWRNGIFGYHHYHSTAHEILGIYGGEAEIQFGGDEGIRLWVKEGDAVLIPAGVAHKKLRASSDFAVVGAYPRDQYPDTCYGKNDERPKVDNNIAALSRPENDPLSGLDGPMNKLWP